MKFTWIDIDDPRFLSVEAVIGAHVAGMVIAGTLIVLSTIIAATLIKALGG